MSVLGNNNRSKKEIKMSRADYAQKTLYLDGKPFSVAAVPFMIPILNCDAEKSILKTGRQVGKSTTLSASILTEQTSTPHYRTLYVAPRNDQVVQFSKDRLSHMIAYSPYIQNFFVDSSVQQQVRAKEFLNGSMVFLRSCYHTADGIRGISANSIFIDEVQDVILDNIPVIEECSARKNPKRMIFCGTPKTYDNAIEKLWQQSTQHHWAVKCRHCGKWNVPLDVENIGKEYLQCAHCKKQLWVLDGEYVASYPDREFVGFHISQCMIAGVPGTNVPWRRVSEKLDDPLYSFGKFKNECLGFSYDVGSKLLTETDLIKCKDNTVEELTVNRKAEWGINTVCAGVDWGVLGGNTHTVVTIGGVDRENKLRVMYARKFPVDQDPVNQIDDICEIINRSGAAVIAADRGGGHVANAFLRKNLSWGRVVEIEYKAKVLQGMVYNDKSRTWVTDRTRAISGVIIDIKTGKLIFPGGNAMRPFFDDLLTLSCEYNDNLRAYQILRAVDVPDDFAHALAYLRIAARFVANNANARSYDLEDFIMPAPAIHFGEMV